MDPTAMANFIAGRVDLAKISHESTLALLVSWQREESGRNYFDPIATLHELIRLWHKARGITA